MPRFVLRRTPDPEGDLGRGWSAVSGEFFEEPDRLIPLADFSSLRKPGETDVDLTQRLRHEGRIRDVIVLQPSGLRTTCWGFHHHDGLACYSLESKDIHEALHEATNLVMAGLVDGGTGGVVGLGMQSPVGLVNQGQTYDRVSLKWRWYVFEASAVEVINV